MRCTQIIGLPKEAEDFLFVKVRMKEMPCPHCGKPITTNKKDKAVYASARDCGMFNDGPELYEYNLKDGSMVREVVQNCPWSSGPCIFLKLVDEKGCDLFVWSDEDIARI